MGVKIQKVNLSKIAKHKYVRFDEKYHNVYNEKITDTIKLDEIFFIKNGVSLTDYYTEEKTNKPFIRIADLSYLGNMNTDNLIYLTEDCPIRDDLIVKEDEIIFATIGNTIGKCNLVGELKGGTFSNNTVCLCVKNKKKFSPRFLELLLHTNLMQERIWGAVSQKAQPNLQDYDLRNILFPNVPIEKQLENLKEIASAETEIDNLKSSKIQEVNIINNVIGEELGIDWLYFKQLIDIKQYSVNLSDYSNNTDCRMSYNFHNMAEKYLWNFMLSKTDKRIKDFISDPIVLGESISPEQYDEDGDYYYIAMSNIKTWAFESKDCKKVKKTYAEMAMKKGKCIKKNDIILARSGEGTIGKVALITDELSAIFADFTQRIRLRNFNPLCAYYYFRSDIFQYFVFSQKKGMGNNTNIFPNQVQEFPMPDWSLEKQTRIALKIKAQLDFQKKIDEQIRQKQQEILQLVENAVK